MSSLNGVIGQLTTLPSVIRTSTVAGELSRLTGVSPITSVYTPRGSVTPYVSSPYVSSPYVSSPYVSSRLASVSSISSGPHIDSVPTEPSSSGPSAGLIAGAVIGGIAALALVGILVLLYLRHKRNQKKKPSTTTPAQVGGVEKQMLNGDVPIGKPEMGTSANAWELQGSGPQGHGDNHVGRGPWELAGQSDHLLGQKR
jgi:hypothetical protein